MHDRYRIRNQCKKQKIIPKIQFCLPLIHQSPIHQHLFNCGEKIMLIFISANIFILVLKWEVVFHSFRDVTMQITGRGPFLFAHMVVSRSVGHS